jgi:ubiquinone/menaquinone biosynthesis C-methylase UbiE
MGLEGFFHYGISYDGKHRKGDFKEQARIVEKYIRDSDSKNVLELAYGMGGNMAFLARRNPRVMFDGVDLALKPLKRFTKIPNAHFQLGDYHDLSAFKDSAYDIVFVIEALCYSTYKLQVLREVKKKLKRDGLFIVIDGYRKYRTTPSPSEETMWKLVERGWSLDKSECVKDVEGYMREEYSIAEANDFSRYILPSMDVIARKVRNYFAHPMFARIVNKLLPFDVAKGLIPPYLAPIGIRTQFACYYIHVLKNNK